MGRGTEYVEDFGYHVEVGGPRAEPNCRDGSEV